MAFAVRGRNSPGVRARNMVENESRWALQKGVSREPMSNVLKLVRRGVVHAEEEREGMQDIDNKCRGAAVA